MDNFYIRSLLGASVYFSPLGSITRQHLNIAKDIVRQLDVVLVLDEVKDWGYVLREKLRIKSLNAYIDNQVEEVDEKEGSDDNAGVRRNMSLLMKPFNSHHHTHMSGKQFFQTAPFPASQSPSQSQSQSQVQPSTDNRSSGRSTSGSGGDGEEDTVDGYTYAMQLNALDYELYAYARSVADRQMRESKDALLHADNAHAQPQ